ncbi:MAG: PstS family phosphate ABC transporter substrate-binding protein [Dehalococcoidia bacterium]|nr:PstS family phosphate ABC transporter substrate-binding protein [Dehalococcoidia bacterium]
MLTKVNKKWFVLPMLILILSSVILAGCSSTAPGAKPPTAPAPDSTGATTPKPTSDSTPAARPSLSGTIEIDGSSTVYPITEAVAEEFRKIYPQVRINVGISGTGGGFKRFVAGETQISDASRPITSSEKEQAAKNNIQWLEMSVAYDGLSVMVNPRNTWVTTMTTAEMKKLWEPGSTVKRWNQIRTEWPDRPINLYGPGTDSGTFDYFTEVITGKAKASRPDYTASEDDNVLVQGIAGDPNALGYFGYAYYIENKDKLKLVAVDAGKGPVLPSEQTIRNGAYSPLSRPIFIYVNKAALVRPEMKEFIRFYMNEGPKLVSEVGYIPMNTSTYSENLTKIQ